MNKYQELKEKGQTSEDYEARAKERIDKYGAPDIMNATECAYVLGVASRTLKNWRKAGVGPPCGLLPGKKKYTYLKSDVLQWVKERTFDPKQAYAMQLAQNYSGRTRPSALNEIEDIVRREEEFQADAKAVRSGRNISWKSRL